MNFIYNNYYRKDLHRLDGEALWEDLQKHIDAGDLIVCEGKADREGLVLVTYSRDYQMSHYDKPWDDLVLNCRGIIFDATNNYSIVALPFAKFFNYGEGKIHYPSEGSYIERVFTKEDGSLGIVFFWNGKWHVTTRGSLNSDIGIKAQEIFDRTVSRLDIKIPFGYTHLFEIVYESNRIVLDYKGREELIFLGMRSTATGECLYGSYWHPEWPYYSPEWKFDTQLAMTEWMNTQKGTEFEGFVVHFSDGSVFKFKCEDYIKLHRQISHFSFNRVLEAYKEGSLRDMRSALPEELFEEFDKWVEDITDRVESILLKVIKVFESAPKTSRKEFAIYLQTYHKGTDALRHAFKLLDFGTEVTDKGIESVKEQITNSLDTSDFK